MYPPKNACETEYILNSERLIIPLFSMYDIIFIIFPFDCEIIYINRSDSQSFSPAEPDQKRKKELNSILGESKLWIVIIKVLLSCSLYLRIQTCTSPSAFSMVRLWQRKPRVSVCVWVREIYGLMKVVHVLDFWNYFWFNSASQARLAIDL